MSKVDASTVMDNQFLGRNNLYRSHPRTSQHNSKPNKLAIQPFTSDNFGVKTVTHQEIMHNQLYKNSLTKIHTPMKFELICKLIKNQKRSLSKPIISKSRMNIRYVVTRSKSRYQSYNKKNSNKVSSIKQFLCLSPETQQPLLNSSTDMKVTQKAYPKCFSISNQATNALKEKSLLFNKSMYKQKNMLRMNMTPIRMNYGSINMRIPWKVPILKNLIKDSSSHKFKECYEAPQDVFAIERLKKTFDINGLQFLNKRIRLSENHYTQIL